MLTSLNEVLWEGTGNWTPPNFRTMIQNNPLQKVYTNACLLIHPDNHIGSPHYPLAKAIFEELNNSMTRYYRSLAIEMKIRRLKLFL